MKTSARRPCRVRKSKGAASAFHADMNSRQLHPSERQLAKELAARSGGKYTAEQIEDAMRNAGNRELGEDITAGMIVRNAEDFYDDGARFSAGTGAAVQELPNGGRVAPDLAAFIEQNTGGGNTPYYWDDVQLGKVQPPAPNPNAHLNTRQPNIHGHITPEAAAGVLPVRNPIRDVDDIRNDVADGAALVGRGAGIVEAAATTAAVVPGAHQPGAATTAVGAAGVGFVANVVEQIARPDQKKFFINQILIGVPADQLIKKYPMLAPVINEASEAIKNQNGTQ